MNPQPGLVLIPHLAIAAERLNKKEFIQNLKNNQFLLQLETTVFPVKLPPQRIAI